MAPPPWQSPISSARRGPRTGTRTAPRSLPSSAARCTPSKSVAPPPWAVTWIRVTAAVITPSPTPLVPPALVPHVSPWPRRRGWRIAGPNACPASPALSSCPLPASLAPLALPHHTVVYHLLCRAASDRWLRLAADPQPLGARLGFLALLHTWGPTRRHPPHVPGVVPAGGLSPDGPRGISCRPWLAVPAPTPPAASPPLPWTARSHQLTDGLCPFALSVARGPWCAGHTWLPLRPQPSPSDAIPMAFPRFRPTAA